MGEYRKMEESERKSVEKLKFEGEIFKGLRREEAAGEEKYIVDFLTGFCYALQVG